MNVYKPYILKAHPCTLTLHISNYVEVPINGTAQAKRKRRKNQPNECSAVFGKMVGILHGYSQQQWQKRTPLERKKLAEWFLVMSQSNKNPESTRERNRGAYIPVKKDIPRIVEANSDISLQNNFHTKAVYAYTLFNCGVGCELVITNTKSALGKHITHFFHRVGISLFKGQPIRRAKS